MHKYRSNQCQACCFLLLFSAPTLTWLQSPLVQYSEPSSMAPPPPTTPSENIIGHAGHCKIHHWRTKFHLPPTQGLTSCEVVAVTTLTLAKRIHAPFLGEPPNGTSSHEFTLRLLNNQLSYMPTIQSVEGYKNLARYVHF